MDCPRAASDAARIDADAKLAITPNAWLFASFDGEFSSLSQSYAGKGEASVTWWLRSCWFAALRSVANGTKRT
jgi:hypothetical protein